MRPRSYVNMITASDDHDDHHDDHDDAVPRIEPPLPTVASTTTDDARTTAP